MAKAIGVIKKDGEGAPDIGTEWTRWVHVGDLPGAYAVYIVVATGPQLLAMQSMPTVVIGMQVTGAGRWNELDQPVPAPMRTKINAYRAAQGQNAIGAGVTLLQVIRGANAEFDWGLTDVLGD